MLAKLDPGESRGFFLPQFATEYAAMMIDPNSIAAVFQRFANPQPQAAFAGPSTQPATQPMPPVQRPPGIGTPGFGPFMPSAGGPPASQPPSPFTMSGFFG